MTIEKQLQEIRESMAGIIAGFALPGFQSAAKSSMLRLFDEIDAHYAKIEFNDHGANI